VLLVHERFTRGENRHASLTVFLLVLLALLTFEHLNRKRFRVFIVLVFEKVVILTLRRDTGHPVIFGLFSFGVLLGDLSVDFWQEDIDRAVTSAHNFLDDHAVIEFV
jgi:hypothetical protein